ncbi:MAG TPA: DsbA family protein [Conexibacter sp.]|nr:DsbA family protein [Conexibacter sp.]
MSEHELSVTHHDGDGPAAHDDAQPDHSQPVFYYDLGSPEAYLAAERVMADLPVVPEWVPILAAGLPGGGSGDATVEERCARVASRAQGQHVQPLRWPAQWPQQDTRVAMVGATYAKQIGRAVAFALAAFRQAFAGGRALDEDTVVIAAAACEMHPRAVLQALGRRSVAAALDAATAAAAAAGVTQVPAIVFGGRVFEGDDAVEQAAAALVEITSA